MNIPKKKKKWEHRKKNKTSITENEINQLIYFGYKFNEPNWKKKKKKNRKQKRFTNCTIEWDADHKNYVFFFLFG